MTHMQTDRQRLLDAIRVAVTDPALKTTRSRVMELIGLINAFDPALATAISTLVIGTEDADKLPALWPNVNQVGDYERRAAYTEEPAK